MALRIALWSAVVVLVLIGLAAAAARTAHVADSNVRMELTRLESFPWLPAFVPDPAARMREITEFDGSFARHPRIARLHTIAGMSFLLLAPLQFMAPLRRRFVRLHRWTGRILLGIGVPMAISALYFGILMPFAGPPESVVIAMAGGFFLFSLGLAFLAIRSGNVERHREWMIRAFAVALGISVVRVMGGLLDITLTPHGYAVRQLLGLSLWLGFALSVAAAEIWIRKA